MRYSDGIPSSGWGHLARAVFLLVGLGILACILLLVFGLPRTLQRALLWTASADGFVIDADDLDVSARAGRFDLQRVRIHQTGVVGPPGIEARSVSITAPLSGFILGAPRIVNMRAEGVLFRPAFLSAATLQRAPGDGAQPPMSFGISLLDVLVGPLSVASATAHVHRQADRFTLEGLDIEFDARNSATGRIVFDSGGKYVEMNLAAELDGALFLDLVEMLTGVTRIGREHLDLDNSRLALRILGQGPVRAAGRDPSVFLLELVAERLTVRGVPLHRLAFDGSLRIAPDGVQLFIDHLVAIHEQGVIEGNVTFDFAKGTALLRAYWGIDIRTFMTLTGKGWPSTLRDIEFIGRSSGEGVGIIGLRDARFDNFEARVRSEQMRYGEWRLDDAAATVTVLGYVYRLPDLRASLWGGTAEADITVSGSSSTGSVWRAAVVVDDADIRDAISQFKLAAPSDTSGRLSGRFHMETVAQPGVPGRTTAEGQAWVTGGRLWTLPLFGNITPWLAALVPGVDLMLTQSDAYADFALEGARLIIPEIRIEGGWITLNANGSADIRDKTLDMRAQIKLLSDGTLAEQTIRFLTFPVSQLLEFAITGPLSSPNWYPVNLSGHLLRRMGL